MFAELVLVLVAAVTRAEDVATEVVEAAATADVDAAVVGAEALPLLAVPETVLPQLASARATIWVAPTASKVRLVKTMRFVFPPQQQRHMALPSSNQASYGFLTWP